MNTFRMISRMFTVVAVVLVVDASAKCPYADKMNAYKGKVGAIAFATALPQNADAAKAAVETAGFACDAKDADGAALALNFATNFVTRKVVHGLAEHGYNLDFVDVIPGALGDRVNPVVKEAIRAAVPQVVASVVVMAAQAAAAKS
jgi:hypothetical protein